MYDVIRFRKSLHFELLTIHKPCEKMEERNVKEVVPMAHADETHILYAHRPNRIRRLQ